ncbi:TPA: glycosyltransferase family 4 protein [Vibrio cholerae]
MKVLYLHQYFATPSSNAGTRSYEMAKRFIEKGHEVTFVTSSAFFSNEFTFEKGWNRVEVDGILLHVYHLPYSNKDSYFSRICKFLSFCFHSSIKVLSIKSDVVFATSTPLTICIPAIIYSKIKKVPMVFEVRDLWPELPIAVGAIKNKLLMKLAQSLESFAYKNSSHIIGLSPGMCEGVYKKFPYSEKITLATNSCDTSLFDVSEEVGKDYKKRHLRFLGNRKLVVYTGTFGIINQVSYIVDLAVAAKQEYPELCFVAVGDGMEKEKVIEYAKSQGVYNENLYFLEPMPKHEIVHLLSAADLALSLFGPVTEMWSNSANKLFDALASITPVAINYAGWQKDLIVESNCGLILDADDTHFSVRKISNFLGNNEQYSRAKNACRNLAYNCYSRDIMAARVEKVLVGVGSEKKAL